MDFFTVPTLTFGVLYCFFVISHGRRKILRCNVTRNPSALWIVQQMREAWPYASAQKLLLSDRDAKVGNEVICAAKNVGTEPIRTTFRSPWQNGVAERWVGSCRRDLLDHVIVLNERHLKRLMREYIRYYHEDRTHLGLAKDMPDGRLVERDSVRERRIQSFARLGGLHHRYAVAAWQAILRTGKLWHGSRLLALLPNRYYLSLLRICLSAHYLSNFEMRRGKGQSERCSFSCARKVLMRHNSIPALRKQDSAHLR